jgi:hypothetical protein
MVLKPLFNYKINSSQQTKYKYDTDRNQLGEMTNFNELLGNDATDNKQITEGGEREETQITKEYILEFLNTVYELYGVSALDQYPFYHNTQFLIHSYCFIVAEYYSSIINNANANEDLTAALTPLSDIRIYLRINPCQQLNHIRNPSGRY